MFGFYGKVVKYRKTIVIVYLVITVFCALLYPRVYVDYDILNYLPRESRSTVSIDVMSEEFGRNIPNTTVMIRNVDQQGAKFYKQKLEEIDGVISVTWLDSMLPLNMPIEMLPPSMVDSYYRDGNALFIITVDEDKQLQLSRDLQEHF